MTELTKNTKSIEEIQEYNEARQALLDENPKVGVEGYIQGIGLNLLTAQDVFDIVQQNIQQKNYPIEVIKITINGKQHQRELNDQTLNDIKEIKQKIEPKYNKIAGNPQLDDLFKDAISLSSYNNSEQQLDLKGLEYALQEENFTQINKNEEFLSQFVKNCQTFETLDPNQEKEYMNQISSLYSQDIQSNKQNPEDQQQQKKELIDNRSPFLQQQQQQQKVNIQLVLIGNYSLFSDLYKEHKQFGWQLDQKISSNIKMYFRIQDRSLEDLVQQQIKLKKINSDQQEMIYKSQKHRFQCHSWSLGFYKNIFQNSANQQQQKQFLKYFDILPLKQAMQLRGIEWEISLNVHPDDQSKSKKIELITSLYNGYELKMEWSYKYCNYVYYNNIDSKNCEFIFSLLIPPKFYIHRIDPNNYMSSVNYDMQFTRLHNFPLFMQQEKIDELARLYFINNTHIRVKLQNCDQQILSQFLEKLEKFKIINYSYMTQELPPRNFMPADFPISYPHFTNNPNLNYDIKYTILCLLSHNKIDLGNAFSDFINYIESLKKDYTSQKHYFFVLEQTLTQIFYLIRPKDNINFVKVFKNIYKKVKKNQHILEQKIQMQPENIEFMKRVTLTPSGPIYSLQDPEMSNRLLRLFKHVKDYFLRIQFSDDNLSLPRNMHYVTQVVFRKFLDSLDIVDRDYKALCWSASQLRASSIWYFSEQNDDGVTVEEIVDKLGYFQDIMIPAKKAARIGQCLSSSIPIEISQQINIAKEEDIKSTSDKLFTDGIGKISKNLIDIIKIELKLNLLSTIQVRLAGAKGVLALDPWLPNDTIVLRKSQLKYETEKEQFQTLDYLDRNKYRAGYLNRQVIILLSTLGIPDQIFQELQKDYLQVLQNCSLKDSSIFKYFNAEYESQTIKQNPICNLIRDMLNVGMDFDNELFMNEILKTLKARAYLTLRKKSNIVVQKAARLIGVTDEYKILKEDEIYCVVSENDNDIEYIEGDIIIARNPCLHPGDIRRMKAVSKKQLEERYQSGINPLDHFVNTVVFPQVGQDPITAQISGSDLDGDLFFICWDKRLIINQNYPPMDYSPPNSKIEQKREVTQEDMLNFYIEYMNNESLGKVDNAWLIKADQAPEKALCKDCIQLAELHSDAVDYVKSGYSPQFNPRLMSKLWPDFMEKKEKDFTYESQSILGILYREAKNMHKANDKSADTLEDIGIQQKEYYNKYLQIDPDYLLPQYEFQSSEIKSVVSILFDFHQDMTSELLYFGVKSEFEVYSGNFTKLLKEERKKKVNFEHIQRRILDRITVLKIKYEKLFLSKLDNQQDEQKFGESKKNFSDYAKRLACLWYLTTYITETNLLTLRQESQKENHYISETYINILEQILKEKQDQQINTRFAQYFIGMPWFIIPQVLIDIKKQAIQDKEKIQNQQINKIKNQSQYLEQTNQSIVYEEKTDLSNYIKHEEQNSDEGELD